MNTAIIGFVLAIIITTIIGLAIRLLARMLGLSDSTTNILLRIGKNPFCWMVCAGLIFIVTYYL